MRLSVAFAMWFAVGPALHAQDAADQAWQLTLRLSQVKRQVRKGLENLPDYTCLATYDRYRWMVNEAAERKVDTVRVEVAYVGGRELYSWPGEGKFSDAPLSSMVGVGMIGDGEFAVHAHNVFVSNNGVETWVGEEQAGGRTLWHWSYKISLYQSGWTVQSGVARQQVGSEGSFWVDAHTLDLVRMENRATDFVEGFPLIAVASTVEYGKVHIGQQDVPLPLHAELKTTAQNGIESRNLTEYSNCRQYAGQSTISFGDPSEPPTPEPPKTNIEETRLRLGLLLQIRLSKELNLEKATVGDLVEGTLAAALRDGNREIAPKGAAVRGRIRLLTRDSTAGTLPGAPAKFTELGLVFDELEFKGHVDRFTAALKSFDSPVPGVRMSLIGAGRYTGNTLTRQELSPAKLPGASVFFIDAGSSGLPKGTLMTWTTQY
jgi:hypothetical protein